MFIRARIIFILSLSMSVFGGVAVPRVFTDEVKVILATTFPIYQFTRNVIGDYDRVRVELMLPAGLGCPHDYVLTPQDMRSLERADLLVKNGLGMEPFLDRALSRVKPGLPVLDSSAGIAGRTGMGHCQGCDHGDKCGEEHEPRVEHDGHGVRGHEPGQAHEQGQKPGSSHGHTHSHAHDRDYLNPHLFASPRQAAQVVMNIAVGLAEFDPAGAGIYLENAEDYAGRLADLAERFAELGRQAGGRRIVVQHDVFDYLAAEMGLEIVALLHVHPGQEPAAAEALRIVRLIRQTGAVAVLAEPQFSDRTARMISRESGVPMLVLDPVANGPEEAPLDHYEVTMENNFRILDELFAQP